MNINPPTSPAIFLDRPNRFVVVARLEEGQEVVRAHCADPGRMKELLLPGTRVHLSRAEDEKRKTAYDLRFVEHPDTGQLISVNSQLANRLFREAMLSDRIEQFGGYRIVRSEIPAPVVENDDAQSIRSRIDFLLENRTGQKVWVEVKSATLVENRTALFPDARTERGRRHVLELARLRDQTGDRAAVVFIVQRPDADELRPQQEIDPDFADALLHAKAHGVELYAYVCDVSLKEVHVAGSVPVVLPTSD